MPQKYIQKYGMFIPPFPKEDGELPQNNEEWLLWIEYYAKWNAFWRMQTWENSENFKAHEALHLSKNAMDTFTLDISMAISFRTTQILDTVLQNKKLPKHNPSAIQECWRVAKKATSVTA
jgi:hypothetical protein